MSPPPVSRSTTFPSIVTTAVSSAVHRPVLVRETLAALDLSEGQFVVDGTVGAAGHAALIAEQLGPEGVLLGIDRDPMMLDHAARKLESSSCRIELRQGSYAEIERILSELELPSPDRVLLDLGLSSDQLADESRGFSFEADGPLDLRFDTATGRPAWQLIAESGEEELTDILQKYGEEPHAALIASALSKSRSIETARDLADLVSRSVTRSAKGGMHPATLTFQALRIAVNEELLQVEQMLSDVLPRVLKAGSRVVAISFHSLEDRIVKNAFRDRDIWTDASGKPVTATPAEARHNPRARSAKLRTAVRI